MLAEALALRTAAPRRSRSEHLELAERLGLAGAQGAALRALARTRRPRSRCWSEACAAAEGSPARLEHTRALVELGAALRRANRRSDAREPLRRALDLADRGGMRLLARRAREELHAAGARPRRAALSGPDALTPGRAPRRRCSPPTGSPTARSPSSSTSPSARSRRTSRTRSRSSTSPAGRSCRNASWRRTWNTRVADAS